MKSNWIFVAVVLLAIAIDGKYGEKYEDHENIFEKYKGPEKYKDKDQRRAEEAHDKHDKYNHDRPKEHEKHKQEEYKHKQEEYKHKHKQEEYKHKQEEYKHKHEKGRKHMHPHGRHGKHRSFKAKHGRPSSIYAEDTYVTDTYTTNTYATVAAQDQDQYNREYYSDAATEADRPYSQAGSSSYISSSGYSVARPSATDGQFGTSYKVATSDYSAARTFPDDGQYGKSTYKVEANTYDDNSYKVEANTYDDNSYKVEANTYDDNSYKAAILPYSTTYSSTTSYRPTYERNRVDEDFYKTDYGMSTGTYTQPYKVSSYKVTPSIKSIKVYEEYDQSRYSVPYVAQPQRYEETSYTTLYSPAVGRYASTESRPYSSEGPYDADSYKSVTNVYDVDQGKVYDKDAEADDRDQPYRSKTDYRSKYKSHYKASPRIDYDAMSGQNLYGYASRLPKKQTYRLSQDYAHTQGKEGHHRGHYREEGCNVHGDYESAVKNYGKHHGYGGYGKGYGGKGYGGYGKGYGGKGYGGYGKGYGGKGYGGYGKGYGGKGYGGYGKGYGGKGQGHEGYGGYGKHKSYKKLKNYGAYEKGEDHDEDFGRYKHGKGKNYEAYDRYDQDKSYDFYGIDKDFSRNMYGKGKSYIGRYDQDEGYKVDKDGGRYGKTYRRFDYGKSYDVYGRDKDFSKNRYGKGYGYVKSQRTYNAPRGSTAKASDNYRQYGMGTLVRYKPTYKYDGYKSSNYGKANVYKPSEMENQYGVSPDYSQVLKTTYDTKVYDDGDLRKGYGSDDRHQYKSVNTYGTADRDSLRSTYGFGYSVSSYSSTSEDKHMYSTATNNYKDAQED